jgi:SAM-dependent methyltransferase
MRVRHQNELEERAVALTRAALVETVQAFDRVAGTYDASNQANATLVAMRERTLGMLRRHVAPGARLLELGCGPGTDTAPLASAGYVVTGIDSSAQMVNRARTKVAGHADTQVLELGIEDVAALAPQTFDAAFSNFGPLNCAPDLPAFARTLAGRLVPGGVLVASVIGRVCPWELALYMSRGEWQRAMLRFSDGFVAVPLAGGRVWTHYYTPVEFERPFRAAGFSRVALSALGLFAPPPYLEGFAARHPRVCQALRTIDDVSGSWPLLRNWGDHFLVVLRRQ